MIIFFFIFQGLKFHNLKRMLFPQKSLFRTLRRGNSVHISLKLFIFSYFISFEFFTVILHHPTKAMKIKKTLIDFV